MNEYLKDNLILGDWLEIFFGSITLVVITLLSFEVCEFQSQMSMYFWDL